MNASAMARLGIALLITMPPSPDLALWGDDAMSTNANHSDGVSDTSLPKRAVARLGTLRFYSPVGEIATGELAVSSDGRLVAVTGPQEIRIFDAANGNVVARFDAPGGAKSVAFSPDNRYVVYGCGDRKIWTADLRGSENVREFLVDEELDFWPTTLRFFADGKMLISNSHGERWVRLWDFARGRQLARIDLGKYAGPLDVSADGTRVATVSYAHFALWELKGKTDLKEVFSEPPEANAVVFFPDARHLAVAQEDGDIAIRSAITGKRKALLRGHVGPVRVLATAPDGATLFSAGDDDTLRAWDPTTGTQLKRIKIPYGVRSIAVFPDGKRLAWCNAFGVVEFSKLPLCDQKREVPIERTSVCAADFSGDGRVVATAEVHGVIRLWEAATGKLLRTVPSPQGEMNCIRRIPGKDLFLSAGEEGTLRVWDAQKGIQVRKCKLARGMIVSIAVADVGETAALAVEDGVSIVNWRAGTEVMCLQEEDWGAMSVAISPDGNRVAGGGGNGVYVWDIKTRKKLLELEPDGPNSVVNSVAFSPDGRLLAFAAGGWRCGQVQVWDLRKQKPIFQQSTRAERGFQAVAFSPDGALLAFVDSKGPIQIVTLPDGAAFLTLHGHEDTVHPNALSFSPDGRRLVSGSADTTALVWDIQKARD